MFRFGLFGTNITESWIHDSVSIRIMQQNRALGYNYALALISKAFYGIMGLSFMGECQPHRSTGSPISHWYGKRTKDNPMKTFKFKLYSNHGNRALHRLIADCVEIYNHCIVLHKRYYRLFGKSLSAYQIKLYITKLKRAGWALLEGEQIRIGKCISAISIIATSAAALRLVQLNEIPVAISISSFPDQAGMDRDRNAALNIHRVGASTPDVVRLFQSLQRRRFTIP